MAKMRRLARPHLPSMRTVDYLSVFFINKISHFHQISVVRQKLSDNIF